MSYVPDYITYPVPAVQQYQGNVDIFEPILKKIDLVFLGPSKKPKFESRVTAFANTLYCPNKKTNLSMWDALRQCQFWVLNQPIKEMRALSKLLIQLGSILLDLPRSYSSTSHQRMRVTSRSGTAALTGDDEVLYPNQPSCRQ